MADTASTTDSENHATDDMKAAGPLSLTFVNAHLAAFDEMVEKRNQEFHELSRRLTFGRDLEEVEMTDTDGNSGEPSMPVGISVFEADALFWMVSYMILGQG